ncbi:MAG: alpha/beta hydrolase [Clostridia bacterium]|nr:alpha/beta hydrolase [Clostridia bacterium]
MLYNFRNGKLTLDGATIHYLQFGKGGRHLIMIPGLGDGLKTAEGMALPVAYQYRAFAKAGYTVTLISRREPLQEGCTTRDMAADLAACMDLLGISQADVLGVSQGGMIAQWLSIDHPEKVRRLVLAVTAPKSNQTVQTVVSAWMDMARQDDYAAIMMDTALKSYSEGYLKKNRLFLPLLGKVGKPKDFTRFLRMAEACLTHDASAHLGSIAAPTMVIGGEKDQIVGSEASRELHQAIAGSQLYLYPEYGHAAYEEGKDFGARVLGFLLDI